MDSTGYEVIFGPAFWLERQPNEVHAFVNRVTETEGRFELLLEIADASTLKSLASKAGEADFKGLHGGICPAVTVATQPELLIMFGDIPPEQLEGQWRTFAIGLDRQGIAITFLRALDDQEGQRFSIVASKVMPLSLQQIFLLPPGREATKGCIETFIHRVIQLTKDAAPSEGGRPIKLGVLDVGQGAAAFLFKGSCPMPMMYLDIGGGVAGNAKTFPANGVKWCFTQSPNILLSHWHWDHWAGATYGGASNVAGPRKSTWLAPATALGPLGIKLVADIVAAGGTVLYWPKNLPPVTAHGFTIGRASGPKWNDSGLVLLAELEQGRLTLAPGDAAYAYLPPQLQPPSRGLKTLLISHHGGHLDKSPPTAIPLPDGGKNCFAYCSVGDQNSHNHPSELNAHVAWAIVRTDARALGANAIHFLAETGNMVGSVMPPCCHSRKCSLTLHT